MSKPKILIQIDTDPQPASFDSVVAIDSGIDHLLRHHSVDQESVTGIIHGAMFTRGPEDLKHTAVFFGGTNAERTDEVIKQARDCFFGPMRVSWMSDPNGSNTTAAAAVLSVLGYLRADDCVTVLGGTGPVGQRIAQLVSPYVAEVRICSRNVDRAEKVCELLESRDAGKNFVATKTSDSAEVQIAIHAPVVIAAGAAGIEFAADGWQDRHPDIRVAVDLNAVPPAGLAGIEVSDCSKQRGGTLCWGAIGVGGLKMKLHKRCLKALFESNSAALDTREIFEIGQAIVDHT